MMKFVSIDEKLLAKHNSNMMEIPYWLEVRNPKSENLYSNTIEVFDYK